MEPAILPVKPGSINAKDKAALRKAGVTVVECEDPAALRLIRPSVELDGFGMLVAAMRGIQAAQTQYTENVAAKVMVREMTKMLEQSFALKSSANSPSQNRAIEDCRHDG